jgi:hypothetical protein
MDCVTVTGGTLGEYVTAPVQGTLENALVLGGVVEFDTAGTLFGTTLDGGMETLAGASACRRSPPTGPIC